MSKGCTVHLARFTNNIARTLLHGTGSFGALALAAMLQRLLKCFLEVLCLAARRSPQHRHCASLYALLLPQVADQDVTAVMPKDNRCASAFLRLCGFTFEEHLRECRKHL